MIQEMNPVARKKSENKIKGFNVRILDDGTYVMRTDNTNYEMCKEYSFKNMEELHKGMSMVMGKIDKKHSDYEDVLTKKAEK